MSCTLLTSGITVSQDLIAFLVSTHVLALQDMLMSFIGFVTSKALLVQLMIKRDSSVVPKDDGLPSHIAWASLQLSFHFEVRSLRAFGVPLHQTHPIPVGGGCVFSLSYAVSNKEIMLEVAGDWAEQIW
jgi:hypothetical protein